MCLITKWKKPRVAKRDITVYKILQGSLHSPYKYFQYRCGRLYKTKLTSGDDFCAFDSEAVNYLNTHYLGWNESEHAKVLGLQAIEKGFHAALTAKRLQRALGAWGELLFTCIVPKGSLYYKDSTGLIASNQIIIVEKYSSTKN